MHKENQESIAGQRLMAGFNGLELNGDLRFLIDTLKIGGLVLFSRNISNRKQLRSLCSDIQKYAKSVGQPPLFIAIDQEGGTVARLPKPFKQFPGNPYIDRTEQAEQFAVITAKELCSVNINMNLAPVMDLNFKGIKSIMAKRAFSSDPKQTSALGVTVIKHLQKNGIIAVAKHFPGIGRTVEDSHKTSPCLDVELDELMSTDLVPFKAASVSNVEGIMLSHILYSKIDPLWPASLSTKVIDILRNRIGYERLVITDDLDMKAIKGKYDIDTIISRIVKAGIDMALICHRSSDIEKAFEKLLEISDKSENRYKDITEPFNRIMNLKRKFI